MWNWGSEILIRKPYCMTCGIPLLQDLDRDKKSLEERAQQAEAQLELKRKETLANGGTSAMEVELRGRLQIDKLEKEVVSLQRQASAKPVLYIKSLLICRFWDADSY